MSKRIDVTIRIEVTDRPLTSYRVFGFQLDTSEGENAALIRMMNAAGASAVEFAMGEREEESDED